MPTSLTDARITPESLRHLLRQAVQRMGGAGRAAARLGVCSGTLVTACKAVHGRPHARTLVAMGLLLSVPADQLAERVLWPPPQRRRTGCIGSRQVRRLLGRFHPDRYPAGPVRDFATVVTAELSAARGMR